jgi:hypothetical protein
MGCPQHGREKKDAPCYSNSLRDANLQPIIMDLLFETSLFWLLLRCRDFEKDQCMIPDPKSHRKIPKSTFSEKSENPSRKLRKSENPKIRKSEKSEKSENLPPMYLFKLRHDNRYVHVWKTSTALMWWQTIILHSDDRLMLHHMWPLSINISRRNSESSQTPINCF